MYFALCPNADKLGLDNDQPCECASVGPMLDNRPARQNGLKKNIAFLVIAWVISRIMPRIILRIRPRSGYYLHKCFRRPRFGFHLHRLFGWQAFGFYLHKLSRS